MTKDSGLCAPFEGMGTPWTEDEIAELHSVLAKYPPEPCIENNFLCKTKVELHCALSNITEPHRANKNKLFRALDELRELLGDD